MPRLQLKGVNLAPRRETFEPIEIASRDEIGALQLNRLKSTLNYAYSNVPHYKKTFDKAGVHPDDLKSLDDLRRFPFTGKDDLRAHYPFGMFAIPREQVRRVHASSGTTGKPTVVGYSRRDLDTWADLMARSMRAAGCQPGMLVQNSYGYGLFTGGIGFHYGAERLGMTVVPVSGGMTERQVRLIADFRPDVIFVTPSYMLAVLDEFHAQGVDPRQSSLKIAMCGAEPWTNAMRAEIENAFDLHAIDNYGLSEIIGPGVSCECIESKDGPHIWEDHFYPEVIDPVTGKVLPDGEVGELVFTTLTKEAMTIVRGVNVFPSQIEEIILKDARLAPHFVIELRRVERLDEITVVVEARPDAEYGSLAACDRDLAHHIKALIGVTAAVRTVKPGTIERSVGKAKRVIDLRTKG